MIVGLGNPGPDYARTRHNVGFQIVDLLAERHSLSFDRFQKRARLGIGSLDLRDDSAKRVVLAKPMTYMNASGESVGALATFYKIAPEDILVVYDDWTFQSARFVCVRAALRRSEGTGVHHCSRTE
jgi:PTH1 family peptidyl-tRNA hydrolase